MNTESTTPLTTPAASQGSADPGQPQQTPHMPQPEPQIAPTPLPEQTPEPVPISGKEILVLTVEDRAAGVSTDYELTPGTELVVGADPSCDVTLEDPYVSGRHMSAAMQDDGSVLVTDLDSRNGTFLRVKDEALELPPRRPSVILAGKTLIGVQTRA